jgi:hypothetical protein
LPEKLFREKQASLLHPDVRDEEKMLYIIGIRALVMFYKHIMVVI